MASPYRILRISDGTTDASGLPNEVNLLCGRTGFCLTEYQATITDLKGGGVWADSALSDGRQLQLAKVQNTVQTLTLEVRAFDTDHLARQTQRLRQLLMQARQYWMTRWATVPVYLEAQAVNESNPRYIEIKNWTTPRGIGVDEGTLWTKILEVGISDFDLVLECGPYWKDHPPGESSCLEIGAMQAWEGTYFGNYDFNSSTREETCAADTVYVVNKHNQAQLTHLYIWNDAPGTWSANLLATSLTYNLLPPAPAADDIIYAGIDSTVTNSGPFSSLVWDLAVAGSGTSFSSSTSLGNERFWQYWNGAGWSWLFTQDNTNAGGAGTGEPLDTAGPGSIHWMQPSDWSVTIIHGTMAYWVRAIVNNVAAPAPPVQQNRQPYTICWPFVEVQADKAGGDVPSLVRLYIQNQSSDPGGTRVLYTDRWIIGLRSLSRGADFTPYLMAASEQLPSGITFTSGGDVFTTPDTSFVTGTQYAYSPGAIISAWTVQARWVLDSTIDEQYFGTFHAFLRVEKRSATAARSIGARMYCTALDVAGGADATYSSRTVYIQSYVPGDPELMDLGRITVPPGRLLSTDDTNGLRFYVELINTDAADVMDILTLILMPVDEMSIDTFEIESETPASTMNLDYTTLLDLDSVTTPKWEKRALRRVTATDRAFGSYAMVGAGSLFIQARAHQRIWFLSEYYQTLGEHRVPEHEQAHSVQMWNVQRYFNLRGDQ